MILKTKAISYDSRVRVFWSLCFISLSCLVIYIYAVNATVRHTVARQNLESEVSNLSTQVGQAEFAYIGMEDNISIDLAYAHGFQDVTNPIYISRTDARSLSMNVR